MSQVDIEEAAANLAAVIARARSGEEVVLSESGKALVQLVPVGQEPRVQQPVRLGRLEGRYRIPDDFDSPLPNQLLDLFEGTA